MTPTQIIEEAIKKLRERKHVPIQLIRVVEGVRGGCDTYFLWENSGIEQGFCFARWWFQDKEWWDNDFIEKVKDNINLDELTVDEAAIIRIGAYLYNYGKQVGRF